VELLFGPKSLEIYGIHGSENAVAIPFKSGCGSRAREIVGRIFVQVLIANERDGVG
jgi:hypothetical protein